MDSFNVHPRTYMIRFCGTASCWLLGVLLLMGAETVSGGRHFVAARALDEFPCGGIA